MAPHDWRRTGVGAICLLLAVALVAPLGPSTAVADTDDEFDATALEPLRTDSYAVEQGDRCIQVAPLGDGSRSVEAYYEYRNPDTEPAASTYSSYGTTPLQTDDTSVLFLYEGADALSLVVVHDRLGGATDGGSATMQFEDLPADGEWVVEDDDYDGRDDEFDHGETASRITWVWSEGRTDGGAFAGLGAEFAVSITPAFGEAADFRYTDGGYDGEVTDWQVLSGDDWAPERTSLDTTGSIQIRSGGCTAVTGIDVDESASVGDDVAIDATVTNAGENAETVTVPFVVDGAVVDEQTVTLEAEETRTLSTTISTEKSGTQTVSVGAATTELEVTEGGFADGLPGSADGLSGFGVGVALAAILVVASLGRRG